MAALAVLWNQAVAFLFVTIQPIFVGALIDHAHYGLAAAGLLVSANMAGSFAGAGLALWLVGRAPVRSVLTVGITLMVMGNVAAGMTVDWPLGLGAASIVSGLGVGIAMSIGSATASAFRNPDRLFAMIMAAQTATGALLLLVGPTLIASFGIGTALFGIAAICATQYLVLPAFATPPVLPTAGTPQRLGSVAWLTLGSLALYYVANSGLWASLERVALAGGVPPAWVGPVFAGAELFAVLGSALAAVLSVRVERLRAIQWACAATGGIALLLAWPVGVGTTILLIALFVAAMSFAVPFYFGLLALAESSGRGVVLAQLALMLGFAIGPGMAGAVAEAGGLPAMHVAITALFGAAWLVAAVAQRGAARLQRAH